ncbi:MAG: cyclohydrolase, partial [Paenibacillus sp.]|nr:cyclohydrolase [Paenibacillus sp.]
MSGVKSLDPAVLALLEPKVQMIPAEKGAIYLVGPIRLPVNLDGETAEFKWYCW